MALDSRYDPQWPTISRTVRELFGQRCARCGYEGRGSDTPEERLQVHHIDENPQNNALENLIPLCARCHLQIEKEARLHAPGADFQLELFHETSYFHQMQEMRHQALRQAKQSPSPSVREMSDEEYEQYRDDWEHE